MGAQKNTLKIRKPRTDTARSITKSLALTTGKQLGFLRWILWPRDPTMHNLVRLSLGANCIPAMMLLKPYHRFGIWLLCKYQCAHHAAVSYLWDGLHAGHGRLGHKLCQRVFAWRQHHNFKLTNRVNTLLNNIIVQSSSLQSWSLGLPRSMRFFVSRAAFVSAKLPCQTGWSGMSCLCLMQQK